MGVWEIISLVVYGATILLGLPSNILALYIFYCRARVRLTPNLIYMINLCLSDLVFILFLPLKMLEKGKMDWTVPGFLCPLYNLIHFGTIYTSALFLTAVSAGRFLGAVYPLHYQAYKKPCYSCLVSVGIWALVGFHGVLLIALENSRGTNSSLFTGHSSSCYRNFSADQLALLAPVRLELSVVLFFLPLLITAFCYAGCIRVLVGSHLHLRKKRRAVRVAVATLSVFVLCFGPYNISHIVGFVYGEDVWWRTVALLPTACNAFLDPLIFYFLSSAMDDGIVQVWRSLRDKCSSIRMKIVLAHGKAKTQQGDGGVA
ncbi:PREDICTED: G-protein coupled receptor 42-like [Thamnophis sirtalis]|uniref:Free fatty acid receptor 1 n=1 Tax=Thamnophis sirtalis TaxID=35019 RepID=A0A6I9XXB8_9SAUR|nr:PREDICTED: G-protein coupled receptor 42-like [Thamnophis sirtalis]